MIDEQKPQAPEIDVETGPQGKKIVIKNVAWWQMAIVIGIIGLFVLVGIMLYTNHDIHDLWNNDPKAQTK